MECGLRRPGSLAVASDARDRVAAAASPVAVAAAARKRRWMQPRPEEEPVPTWATWREAIRVVLLRRHLRATIRIALVVGTVLFTINQLDVVLSGNATTATYVKSAVTYLVPFTVSNLGVLTGTRRRRHMDQT